MEREKLGPGLEVAEGAPELNEAHEDIDKNDNDFKPVDKEDCPPIRVRSKAECHSGVFEEKLKLICYISATNDDMIFKIKSSSSKATT